MFGPTNCDVCLFVLIVFMLLLLLSFWFASILFWPEAFAIHIPVYILLCTFYDVI